MVQAYDANQTENYKYFSAYSAFSTKRDQLFDMYALDRKKAKVISRNDPVVAERLGIRGSVPRTYMNWLETARKFYTSSTADPEIQTQLARLKITPEHLTQANTLITDLEGSRNKYLQEKGESQDATKLKDAAFTRIDEWMRDFYAVAKIALEDRPQLVESLGKLVRS